MDQENTGELIPNDRSIGNKAQFADPPPITFSQDKIVEVLLESGGLTTLAPKDPVLIEPDDDEYEYGAKHFEKILDLFFVKTEQKRIKPALNWIAVDGESLARVVRPLEANHPKRFDWLLEHATFARLSSPGAAPIVLRLLEELSKVGSDEPLALTRGKITSTGFNAGYDLHFQPLASSNRWPNGSQCRRLAIPLKWMDEIVHKVNNCHDDVLNKGKRLEKNEAFQYLNRMGVSILPLKEIVSEFGV